MYITATLSAIKKINRANFLFKLYSIFFSFILLLISECVQLSEYVLHSNGWNSEFSHRQIQIRIEQIKKTTNELSIESPNRLRRRHYIIIIRCSCTACVRQSIDRSIRFYSMRDLRTNYWSSVKLYNMHRAKMSTPQTNWMSYIWSFEADHQMATCFGIAVVAY